MDIPLLISPGQRKGIGLSHESPYYVTAIDAAKNIIYVGEEQDIYRSEFIAGKLNFIPFDSLSRKMVVKAKTRYVSPLSAAIIEPHDENTLRVIFKKAQWAITPGQSVVFYADDIVLGGGVIDSVLG